MQFAINTSKPPAPVALQGRLRLSAKPHEYKRSLVWLNLCGLVRTKNVIKHENASLCCGCIARDVGSHVSQLNLLALVLMLDGHRQTSLAALIRCHGCFSVGFLLACFGVCLCAKETLLAFSFAVNFDSYRVSQKGKTFNGHLFEREERATEAATEAEVATEPAEAAALCFVGDDDDDILSHHKAN
mgnify:CR=1 FL=1